MQRIFYNDDALGAGAARGARGTPPHPPTRRSPPSRARCLVSARVLARCAARRGAAAVAPTGHALPAGHDVHAAAPADEKEPAEQSGRTLLNAGAYSPAAQRRAAVAAMGRAEFAGQLPQPACDVRSVAAL